MTKLPSPIVCTGFHRSGTSLAAQWLHKTGFDLGARLVPPHPSNPDGHFEDEDVVALHDRWLARQCTDWVHASSEPPAIDEELISDIQAYAANRTKETAAWAIKDPRATLCLPAWETATQHKAHYLLVVRHWTECAQSLLFRHSRELAYHLPRGEGARQHLRLWVQPQLAYQAWLSANRALLHFASTNQSCSIVTADFLRSANCVELLLSDGRKVALTANDKPRILQGLLRDAPMSQYHHALDPALLLELDGLWDELTALTELKSPADLTKRDYTAFTLINETHTATTPARSLPETNAAPRNGDGALDVAKILADVEQRPVENRAIKALAETHKLMVAGRLEDALSVVKHGLSFTPDSVDLNITYGDLLLRLSRAELALAPYQLAAQTKNTPGLRLRLVKAWLARGEYQSAQRAALQLLHDDPGNQEVIHHVGTCILAESGPEAAIAWLETQEGLGHASLLLLAKLLFPVDYIRANQVYLQAVIATISKENLESWRDEILSQVTDQHSRSRLEFALHRHWDALQGLPAPQPIKIPSAGQKTT